MVDTLQLPAEIQCEPTGIHGVRYVFPRRKLGRFRAAGTFAILFGVLFTTIPAVILGFGVVQMIQRGKLDPFDILPLVFTLPFFVVGIAIVGAGVLFTRGHAEVELTDDMLLMRDRAGLLRWTRKLPVLKINAFRVVHIVHTQNTLDWAALTAVVRPQRNRIVVVGYPESWLQPLADEVAARIADETDTKAVPIERTTTRDASATADDEVLDGEPFDLFEQIDQARKPVTQPSTSKTKVERFEGGGITLNVPSAGLIKGSSGLFVFAVFWCVLTLVVGSGFFLANGQANAFAMLAVVVPIVFLFLAIGIAMLLVAINMGIRRVAIAVFDGSLMLMTKGLFGTRKLEWDAPEIKAVVVGRSGMEVNERPVMELQVHTDEKKTGLLAGHDEEELYWLADEIRRALKATGAKDSPT